MVKKYILFFVCIILLSMISAQGSLGGKERGQCIELPQTCANCTYNNITSILYPNSTEALSEVAMTKDNTEYNYTFCDTTTLGTYIVNGKGDPDGDTEVWVYEFEITPTGNQLNSSQGFMYIFMLIVMIGLLLFSLYGSLKIPWQNERNMVGEVLRINWKKYLKMFSIGMSYVFLLWVVFLAWNLSWAYLQMQGLSTFFRYVYTLLMGLGLPIFATMVIISAVTYINDKKIQKLINQWMGEVM